MVLLYNICKETRSQTFFVKFQSGQIKQIATAHGKRFLLCDFRKGISFCIFKLLYFVLTFLLHFVAIITFCSVTLPFVVLQCLKSMFTFIIHFTCQKHSLAAMAKSDLGIRDLPSYKQCHFSIPEVTSHWVLSFLTLVATTFNPRVLFEVWISLTLLNGTTVISVNTLMFKIQNLVNSPVLMSLPNCSDHGNIDCMVTCLFWSFFLWNHAILYFTTIYVICIT